MPGQIRSGTPLIDQREREQPVKQFSFRIAL